MEAELPPPPFSHGGRRKPNEILSICSPCRLKMNMGVAKDDFPPPHTPSLFSFEGIFVIFLDFSSFHVNRLRVVSADVMHASGLVRRRVWYAGSNFWSQLGPVLRAL